MLNCKFSLRCPGFLFLVTLILSVVSNFPVYSNGLNAEEDWEALLDGNEKLALEAIKGLHRQLDDDKDGSINLVESNEFLREELKYDRDFEKRHKGFIRTNDNQVTIRELWETWVESEVHNWTNDQTIEWLSFFVGLPQYSNAFVEKSINGSFLPRLAVNHQQFLSSGLGVKDIIHRNKISLKAQDVVLFGPPKEYTNYVKDVILTSLLIIAIGICWNVYARYKSSQRELSKIIKDMESLAKAEKELQDLQNVMEKTKVEREELTREIEKSLSQRSFLELELPDDQVREEISRLRNEVEVLRSELQRAEVELQDKCWVPPPALQHWLQLTYELELKTYNRKKQSAERQLRQAKDACDKLKKKRSSLMGAFVSTHGKSIDDVDKAILEAKGSLTEITHELQERMNRWKQIEILGNCPIMNNPGLHYLETVLRGYGKVPSYGGPASVISNSQDDVEDDAASSIYTPSADREAIKNLTSTSPAIQRLELGGVQGVKSKAESETTDAVFAPVPPPTFQLLTMLRSKSTGNMQSLRSGRDVASSRDSGTEDSTEASSDVTMGTARDKRVKFGATRLQETRTEESNDDVDKKQNDKVGPIETSVSPPSVAAEEPGLNRLETEAGQSSEKPDLIKLSSYPEVRKEDAEESGPEFSPDDVNDAKIEVNVHNGVIKEEVQLMTNVQLNGRAEDCNSSSKASFSKKVRVWRSISRLVANGTETLRAKRKVQAPEPDKANQVNERKTEDPKDKPFNSTESNGILVLKKPRSKLFSSFRTKK